MLSDTMMLGGGRKAAYSIKNSLLFRGGQYLSRTPGVPGNQKLWTYSTWVRWTGAPETFGQLLSAGYTTGTGFFFCHALDGTFTVVETRSPSDTIVLRTSKVFRDPTAWLHVVLVYDSANETASERVRLYINGARVAFDYGSPYALFPEQNFPAYPNGTYQHWIGCFPGDTSRCLMEYVAEPVFVDNSALAPSAFGETDPVTGSWRPKALNVSAWGANGFYLGKPWNSASLGTDHSGKGNHWTPTGFLATDVLKDSPTNVYATLNPLNYSASRMALFAGNLVATPSNGSGAGSTLRLSSGMWYFETTLTSGSGAYNCVGLFDAAANVNMGLFARDGGWFVGSDGTKYDHGTATAGYGAAAVAGDRLMCAVDMDAGKVWWGKNGAWFSGVPATGTAPAFDNLAGKVVCPGVAIENGYSQEINFGQRPFAFTPPSGFKALCTANLPTPISAAAKQPWKYYSCQLVTHNGTSTAFTLGWNPDPANGGSHTLFRVKNLVAASWYWHDTVRGIDKFLNGDSTAAEFTSSTHLMNLSTTGASLGEGQAAGTYLVEAWRVAPEAGFDILNWTGNGTRRTIPHNNGTAPAFMIVKNRDNGAEGWSTWHKDLTSAGYILTINNDNSQLPSATDYDSTAPIASSITVGTNLRTNENLKPFVAYVWSEVPGFSAFGSYVGNGAQDGPFDWLGFTPAAVEYKRFDANAPWCAFDTARSPRNAVNNLLYLDTNEAVNTSGPWIDITASGVKFRDNGGYSNSSGGKYIYAAWAAHPLGAKRVTPATAR